jgi:hypothetical protein
MPEPLGLPSHVSEIYRSLLRQPGSLEDFLGRAGNPACGDSGGGSPDPGDTSGK